MKNSQFGFTLLELMVVLGLVAAVIAFGVPKLANKNSQVRSALRKLSAVSKQVHTQAALQGGLYRLVFVLGETDKEAQSYRVERSSKRSVLSETDIESRAGRPADEDDEGAKREAFEADPRLGRDVALPKVLRVSDVEIEGVETPITSGQAAIHFFPQGRVESAVIHLVTESEQEWSIAIHPLTGHSTLIPRRASLREINGQ